MHYNHYSSVDIKDLTCYKSLSSSPKGKRSEEMNNINWNWETHFSIDSSVLLKIGVVILLLF